MYEANTIEIIVIVLNVTLNITLWHHLSLCKRKPLHVGNYCKIYHNRLVRCPGINEWKPLKKKRKKNIYI